MTTNNATRLDTRKARELKEFVAQLRALLEQGRLDEAEALVLGYQRPPTPVFKSNARCDYIHGRGWIPKPIKE